MTDWIIAGALWGLFCWIFGPPLWKMVWVSLEVMGLWTHPDNRWMLDDKERQP